MTAVLSLPMNAVLPCGSPSARRRHQAAGEVCVRCEPDVEWTSPCPACNELATVVGGAFANHFIPDTRVVCSRAGKTDQRPRARLAS